MFFKCLLRFHKKAQTIVLKTLCYPVSHWLIVSLLCVGKSIVLKTLCYRYPVSHWLIFIVSVQGSQKYSIKDTMLPCLSLANCYFFLKGPPIALKTLEYVTCLSLANSFFVLCWKANSTKDTMLPCLSLADSFFSLCRAANSIKDTMLPCL